MELLTEHECTVHGIVDWAGSCTQATFITHLLICLLTVCSMTVSASCRGSLLWWVVAARPASSLDRQTGRQYRYECSCNHSRDRQTDR